jgi:hypothetical protein
MDMNEDFQADANMCLIVLITTGIVALIFGDTLRGGGISFEKSK